MAGKDIGVVLVHGAWADGSSWSKVITGLAARRVRSISAQLSLSTLNDDVVSLDRAIDRIGGPVVLVGHAYGGTVIGATRHPAVKSLVYVAGVAPAEGEAAAQAAYRGQQHPLAPKLTPDSNGWVWLPEDAFATAFAPDATAEEQAVLAAVQRPASMGAIGIKVGAPRWKDVPAWYVLAQNDRMVVADNQQFMAERMAARIRPVEADHTPLITAPGKVVSTILEALQTSSH
jgi:pimeloyl-ACP methyl ester carboxylesterase